MGRLQLCSLQAVGKGKLRAASLEARHPVDHLGVHIWLFLIGPTCEGKKIKEVSSPGGLGQIATGVTVRLPGLIVLYWLLKIADCLPGLQLVHVVDQSSIFIASLAIFPSYCILILSWRKDLKCLLPSAPAWSTQLELTSCFTNSWFCTREGGQRSEGNCPC